MCPTTNLKRPEQFRADYYAYLNMCRAFPALNHSGHDPQPENYGLDESEAKWIRVKTEREYNR